MKLDTETTRNFQNELTNHSFPPCVASWDIPLFSYSPIEKAGPLAAEIVSCRDIAGYRGPVLPRRQESPRRGQRGLSQTAYLCSALSREGQTN